jgi:hypothetical protein
MPKVSQMLESKYLKKDDVGEGVLATFRTFKHVNVAQEDQQADMKWVAYFNELEKPLVLNSTNIQVAAMALGSDNTDDWIGKQIVLYVDPNVSFGGKVVGGIRLRAPKGKAVAKAEDDVPF